MISTDLVIFMLTRMHAHARGVTIEQRRMSTLADLFSNSSHYVSCVVPIKIPLTPSVVPPHNIA
jgi:hypothetical protein